MIILKKLTSFIGTLLYKFRKTKKANNLTSSQVESSTSDIRTINGLPFATYQRKPGEIIIIMGNNMISEKVFRTHEQALEYLKNPEWPVILNCIYFISKQLKSIENGNK